MSSGQRRAEQPGSTRISRPRSRTASGPTAPARSCRATLPPPLIKGRYGEPILHPHLQQHAGRPHAEQRLRPQRDPAALPQRAQRRGERRRGQRPPLPRHVLRLPLEHDAGPPRQDQHPGDRPPRLGARRQWRPGQRGGRLPRAAGHHVGARPPLLLHRRERLQGQSRHDQLLQRPRSRQRGAGRRRQPAAAERHVCWIPATSTSTST